MHGKTHALILTALLAALTAVGAFLRIPLGPSGLTLQTFFTAMAGILLGAKYGALSQGVYVALGLIGMPIFLSGGGLSYVLQPTFGFLLGLIPCAWVIGRLTAHHHSPGRMALATAAGYGALYLVGLPYLALILNVYLGKGLSFGALMMAGMIPFLPGDVVKLVGITVLCPQLLRRLQHRR